LHLGNLRTALLAWLFARSAGSRFVLRIEDLDPVASRRAHEHRQLDDLAALGLEWDPPVMRQSERRAAHDDAIAALDHAGLTYPCYCTRREISEAARAPNAAPTRRYPGTCRSLSVPQRARREADGRPPALRLRAGAMSVTIHDRLAGAVTGVVDDIVVRRNDGVPAYNLAVVVDDDAQGVEEVVRGDDLLASTPAHVHLATRLGIAPPGYAHVPLVVAPSGERLAKRDGAVTMADRAALGEDAPAVRGLLAVSLGLAAAGERPSLEDLLDRFDPATLPREPWTFAG
jgi:glutamyl-tRNA synthetase